jgi:hypothetical protein
MSRKRKPQIIRKTKVKTSVYRGDLHSIKRRLTDMLGVVNNALNSPLVEVDTNDAQGLTFDLTYDAAGIVEGIEEIKDKIREATK